MYNRGTGTSDQLLVSTCANRDSPDELGHALATNSRHHALIPRTKPALPQPWVLIKENS